MAPTFSSVKLEEHVGKEKIPVRKLGLSESKDMYKDVYTLSDEDFRKKHG